MDSRKHCSFCEWYTFYSILLVFFSRALLRKRVWILKPEHACDFVLLSASQSHAAYHDLPLNIRLSVFQMKQFFFRLVGSKFVSSRKKHQNRLLNSINAMTSICHDSAVLRELIQNCQPFRAKYTNIFLIFSTHYDDRLWCAHCSNSGQI